MRAKLITRDGFEALKKELDYLWRKHRPEITRKVQWAASLGDRSENADYTLVIPETYYYRQTTVYN